MKRILVPIDFSQPAEGALKVAAQIAKKSNSEIILLHLLEFHSHANNILTENINIPETMLFIQKTNETITRIKHEPYLNGISVTEIVKLDKVSNGITTISKEYNVDLIVMGSQGTSSSEELLIGSNTEKIVRHSEIPVLIIRKEIENFTISNFVFASDFSEKVKEPFQKLLNFTNLFNPKLHLVIISTPDNFKTTQEATKAMNLFIQKFKLTNYTAQIHNDSSIEKGILSFSKNINADIIGLCTHGRAGLSLFFNGSISEGLVNHTTKPIMTLKI